MSSVSLTEVKTVSYRTAGTYVLTIPTNAIGLTCTLVGAGGGGGGGSSNAIGGNVVSTGGGAGGSIKFPIVFYNSRPTITAAVGTKGTRGYLLNSSYITACGGGNSYINFNPITSGVDTVYAGGGGGGLAYDGTAFLTEPGMAGGSGGSDLTSWNVGNTETPSHGGGIGGYRKSNPSPQPATFYSGAGGSNDGLHGCTILNIVGYGSITFVNGAQGYGGLSSETGAGTLPGAGGAGGTVNSNNDGYGYNGADGLVLITWMFKA